MSEIKQELLDSINSKMQAQIPISNIILVLQTEGYSNEEIKNAYRKLGIDVEDIASLRQYSPKSVIKENNDHGKEGITLNTIIDKFIPIAGALLLIIGFGYLIYANAWVNLAMEIRLTLGFFFSVAIIGGSFSLPEKMRDFTDIGIGSGVLLLYGTLIYGSRTTDLAVAMIPEMVTLLTAALFTVAVSYFASMRNSKVILILGMIGAYLTPFVIGQNDVWVSNISFNAYLMYFFAVNVAVFLIGREISVRNIIPLNIIGLFLGVTTLWNLAYSEGIRVINYSNFLSGEIFTALLFFALVVFSIWSILLSSQKFEEKDEGYLSLGYIAPVIWFAYNITNLHTLQDSLVAGSYALIAASCFFGWHYLGNIKTRFQHTALYAAGLLSLSLAFLVFLEEFNVFSSILISYTSFIFAFLYLYNSDRLDRFNSYLAVSLIGALLSLHHILTSNLDFKSLLVVVSLLPAMSAYQIAKNGTQKSVLYLSKMYSIVWSLVALMAVVVDFADYLNVEFFLMYLIPLLALGYLSYVQIVRPESISLHAKSVYLRIVLFWFSLGFVQTFFELVNSIYPAPRNTFLLTSTKYGTDWVMLEGVVATIILFVGLWISRKLQAEQTGSRPSFILVIFSFATLLLAGNYVISALANDFGVPHIDGGPRALFTTLWWSAIAIFMLYKGIKLGVKYQSEKLLGLLLLGITLIKVILYDISTMGMQNKIIVMMLVGGAMLLFSYVVRSKDLLKKQDRLEN